jgi:uncharacterized protein (TIGR03083 family)
VSAPITDDELASLLGAYALDACDPDEAARVEELLGVRPELAREAAELAAAAAWLGATEALAPPTHLRRAVFERVRRPRPGADPAAQLYAAEAERVAAEFDQLDPDDDDVGTPNGLTARQLVAHVAAQESLLALAIGHPVESIDLRDIEARTTAFVHAYANRPFSDLVETWRRAVDTIIVWASDPAHDEERVEWLGLPLPRDQVLVARAFENWLHRDDLRRVRGRRALPPPADEMHLLAEMAVAMLGPAMATTGKARPGHRARLVLTGDGGGDWSVDLGSVPAATGPPSVTIRANVVDWCLVAGERLDPAHLAYEVEGDVALAEDLVHAASAFAVL